MATSVASTAASWAASRAPASRASTATTGIVIGAFASSWLAPHATTPRSAAIRASRPIEASVSEAPRTATGIAESAAWRRIPSEREQDRGVRRGGRGDRVHYASVIARDTRAHGVEPIDDRSRSDANALAIGTVAPRSERDRSSMRRSPRRSPTPARLAANAPGSRAHAIANAPQASPVARPASVVTAAARTCPISRKLRA